MLYKIGTTFLLMLTFFFLLLSSWDNLYTKEISNYAEDPTDEGTIWFDDSGAEDKMVSFLEEKIVEEKVVGDAVGKDTCSFLDLGTGNGHFLFRLREGEEDEDGEDDEDDNDENQSERSSSSSSSGWKGRMLGVDYSQKSVEFSQRIASEKGLGAGTGPSKEILFRRWDIMGQSPEGVVFDEQNPSGWDVVLDKGTFDAISLSEERDSRGRRICEGYVERVVPLIRDGGILLITSCNWTEEELIAWFQGEDLKYLDTIKYKNFSFGGQKGQTISSVCFKKDTVR